MKTKLHKFKVGDIVMPIDSDNIFDQMLIESINGYSVRLISLSSFNVIRSIYEIEYVCSSKEVTFLPFFLIFPYGYYLQSNGDKIFFNRCYDNIWAITLENAVFNYSDYSHNLEVNSQNKFYLYDKDTSPWKSPHAFFQNINLLHSLGLNGRLPIVAKEFLSKHQRLKTYFHQHGAPRQPCTH